MDEKDIKIDRLIGVLKRLRQLARNSLKEGADQSRVRSNLEFHIELIDEEIEKTEN